MTRAGGVEDPAASAELVVETAVSSLRDDLGPKRDDYARAGLQEYWVVAPKQRELHVFRAPANGMYAVADVLGPADRISPLFAQGRGEIAVADLF